MKKFCRLVLLLLLLGGTCSLGAPELPDTVRTEWVYQVNDSSSPGGAASATVQIAGQEEINGQPVLKIETRTGDEIVKTEWITLGDAGVQCLRRAGCDGKAINFDPPQTILPPALRVCTPGPLRK
ncbi:hypothetical protein BH20VER1_BH20VER1_27540 [soil metagenome]